MNLFQIIFCRIRLRYHVSIPFFNSSVDIVSPRSNALLYRLPSAAQPQPNFLYESGEIASEKALAMTATMHFDGTLHVVIASEAKQSFTHKKNGTS